MHVPPDLTHIAPLREATAAHGGKAATLARLLRLGVVEVCDGLAIAAAAHANWLRAATPTEAERLTEMFAAGLRLAWGRAFGEPAPTQRFLVRSSSTAEDGASRAAAGIFVSVGDLTARELGKGLALVWQSSRGALAKAYGVADAGMGVVVQAQLPGARVTVYVPRPAPGAKAAASPPIMQWRADAAQAPVVWQLDTAPLVAQPCFDAALAVDAALGYASGSDLELVCGEGPPVVVQARPLVVATTTRTTPPPRLPPPDDLFAFSRATPTLRWQLDLAHNPGPISVAQAELVAFVCAQAGATYAMRVVGGYLYYGAAAAARMPGHDDPLQAPMAREQLTPEALRSRMVLLAQHLAPKAQASHEPADPSLGLTAALARYADFYVPWMRDVVPLLRAAHQQVVATELAGRPPAPTARPNAPATILREYALGGRTRAETLALLGDVSPAWDVAAPTLRETPARLEAWVDAYRAMALPAPANPPASSPTSKSPSSPSLAAELAYWQEADDYWFYAAQADVRRALLALGEARGLGEDVMWTPWTLLRDGAATTTQLRAAAATQRALAEVAARTAMPRSFLNGAIDGAIAPVTTATQLRGTWAPQSRPQTEDLVGAVVPLAPDALPPLTAIAGKIAVCQNITPGTALAVAGARAIIAATGGPLDHGAALAAELGIPTLVGCEGCGALAEGVVVAISPRGEVATLA